MIEFTVSLVTSEDPVVNGFKFMVLGEDQLHTESTYPQSYIEPPEVEVVP